MINEQNIGKVSKEEKEAVLQWVTDDMRSYIKRVVEANTMSKAKFKMLCNTHIRNEMTEDSYDEEAIQAEIRRSEIGIELVWKDYAK